MDPLLLGNANKSFQEFFKNPKSLQEEEPVISPAPSHTRRNWILVTCSAIAFIVTYAALRQLNIISDLKDIFGNNELTNHEINPAEDLQKTEMNHCQQLIDKNISSYFRDGKKLTTLLQKANLFSETNCEALNIALADESTWYDKEAQLEAEAWNTQPCIVPSPQATNLNLKVNLNVNLKVKLAEDLRETETNYRQQIIDMDIPKPYGEDKKLAMLLQEAKLFTEKNCEALTKENTWKATNVYRDISRMIRANVTVTQEIYDQLLAQQGDICSAALGRAIVKLHNANIPPSHENIELLTENDALVCKGIWLILLTDPWTHSFSQVETRVIQKVWELLTTNKENVEVTTNILSFFKDKGLLTEENCDALSAASQTNLEEIWNVLNKFRTFVDFNNFKQETIDSLLENNGKGIADMALVLKEKRWRDFEGLKADLFMKVPPDSVLPHLEFFEDLDPVVRDEVHELLANYGGQLYNVKDILKKLELSDLLTQENCKRLNSALATDPNDTSYWKIRGIADGFYFLPDDIALTQALLDEFLTSPTHAKSMAKAITVSHKANL